MPIEERDPFIIGQDECENCKALKEKVEILTSTLELCVERLDCEVGFTGEGNQARLVIDEIKNDA